MELSGHPPSPPCWLQSWVPGYCSCNSCTFAPFHSPLPRPWPRELVLTRCYIMKPCWGLLSTATTAWTFWLSSTGSPVKNKEWLSSVDAGIWECMQGSSRYCSYFYIPGPSPGRFPCWLELWPSPIAWTFRVSGGRCVSWRQSPPFTLWGLIAFSLTHSICCSLLLPSQCL